MRMHIYFTCLDSHLPNETWYNGEAEVDGIRVKNSKGNKIRISKQHFFDVLWEVQKNDGLTCGAGLCVHSRWLACRSSST